MESLTDAPVLDKDDRPKEEKRRVNDGIGIAEVVSYETKEGNEDEGMRVGSEKCKVESDGLAELVRVKDEEMPRVLKDGTYLTANKIQLFMTNVDGFCEGTNPNIIIFGIMKGHDGFYARPGIIVRMYAEVTI